MTPPSLPAGVWFDYPVIVQPHHTDYAGIVWHGSYLAWMEEARIAALREAGLEFADLVALGCDLPVVHLALKYRAAPKMGDCVRVRSRLERIEKVRLIWTQNICAIATELCYVAGQVTIVPVHRDQRRILRKLPPLLQKTLENFYWPDVRNEP